jgi:hypothetical protein
MSIVNPVEYFHRIRRICFAIFSKGGAAKALDFLEKVKKELGVRAYIGLKEEIHFYKKYGEKFSLTVALDAGESCDFSGNIDHEPCRIDVTTNIAFKKLEEYEPFQRRGRKYKIALMDYKTHRLIDIIDINFPFCEECGGRLFDIVILTLPESQIPGLTDTQKIVSICSEDPYSHFIVRKEESFFIPDFEEIDPEDVDLNKYAFGIATFFKKRSQLNIVACGGESYITVAPDGDGFWGTKLYWKHQMIAGEIDDQFDTLFSDF